MGPGAEAAMAADQEAADHEETHETAGRTPVEQMSRHLIGLSTAMRLRMRAGLIDRGHELRPSTAQVIPNLPRDGLRVSQLASRLRLTLQRTGQLVGELEEVGYLERIPDPTDGRAKRVVFSSRGLELIRDIDEITAEITDSFAARVGSDRLGLLCELLEELDLAVNGADSPVRVVAEPSASGRG
jgi:DNA-binding MarR family transcriptional regulator